MNEFAFISQGVPHCFRDKPRLKRWLTDVVKAHGATIGSLTFVLMSDEELRSYNQRFLGRDYLTDVIAFDGQIGEGISGDILISYHRTLENASSFGISHQHELRRVIVHGLLHLLGHKDNSMASKARMHALEDEWLCRY